MHRKRRVSASISELVSYFKEANKKFIFVKGSEKTLKDLENLILLQLFIAIDSSTCLGLRILRFTCKNKKKY